LQYMAETLGLAVTPSSELSPPNGNGNGSGKYLESLAFSEINWGQESPGQAD